MKQKIYAQRHEDAEETRRIEEEKRVTREQSSVKGQLHEPQKSNEKRGDSAAKVK